MNDILEIKYVEYFDEEESAEYEKLKTKLSPIEATPVMIPEISFKYSKDFYSAVQGNQVYMYEGREPEQGRTVKGFFFIKDGVAYSYDIVGVLQIEKNRGELPLLTIEEFHSLSFGSDGDASVEESINVKLEKTKQKFEWLTDAEIEDIRCSIYNKCNDIIGVANKNMTDCYEQYILTDSKRIQILKHGCFDLQRYFEWSGEFENFLNTYRQKHKESVKGDIQKYISGLNSEYLHGRKRDSEISKLYEQYNPNRGMDAFSIRKKDLEDMFEQELRRRNRSSS